MLNFIINKYQLFILSEAARIEAQRREREEAEQPGAQIAQLLARIERRNKELAEKLAEFRRRQDELAESRPRPEKLPISPAFLKGLERYEESLKAKPRPDGPPWVIHVPPNGFGAGR